MRRRRRRRKRRGKRRKSSRRREENEEMRRRRRMRRRRIRRKKNYYDITHDSNKENLPSVMGTETTNYTKTEHDLQCTYYITLRRVCATNVAVEKQ
jgi:hypothetical protein